MKKPAEIFEKHNNKLRLMFETRKSLLIRRGDWKSKVEEAEASLEEWSISGRKQNYDSEELADAKLFRHIANLYEFANNLELNIADALHQAHISEYLLSSGLNKILISEGKKGMKLGVLELSARLMPILTFPCSSSYFEVGVIPYSKESREILGENVQRSFVNSKVALESATNIANKFGVHYSLAETSAAPRTDVPRSGRKPGLYICGIIGDEVKLDESYVIDTPFRSEFNAIVRKHMYGALKKMYGTV
ncbi:hypothetical protein HN385_01885 [archaeon]|jgi:nicotinamide mononucleotide (NMN) deamidase PncC|nr:hypothetical protein [archaeon]MBT6869439.1 hypothetical protein [archaeon]MBT7192602.1 hypothetical protein [archaeon]MBT7380678.1 hypothetical protein [archaeon]MBT7507917.1 hypothetical protein [archaeon]